MSVSEPWVWLNGEWLLAASARVSPLSEGFMFGYGLFETLRLTKGRVGFVAAHHDRMNRSAGRVGLNLRSTANDWASVGAELARRNGHEDGVLKHVLFKDVTGVSELMTTGACPYSEQHYARGFAMKTKVDARPEGAAREKSLSYLDDWLARQRARAEGFDDALSVSATGEIYEGAATNVFAVIEGRLVTSPIEKHVIPGVARAQILARVRRESRVEALRDAEIDDVLLGADERALTLAELGGADEIFVTNAVLGVMPVSRIDGTHFPLRPHGIVPHLQRAFARWQSASV